MKNPATFLMTATIALAAAGLVSAGSFENDLRAGREKLMLNAGEGQVEIADPVPVPVSESVASGTRWWSVTFFGSPHRSSTKAAIKFMNKSLFPDIATALDILKSASNDETGHLSSELNGGPVKEIWFGNTPFSKGGVLANYTQFKFKEAYQRLGTLCHLTQDQSVPVHVANISHGIGDSFENAPNSEVYIRARRDNGDRQPYEYYQILQDETRSKLAGWTDPSTGLPYWELAADAPPPGQDVTYGPWGHYGGKKNRDTYSFQASRDDNYGGGGGNTEWTSLRPEIRLQQLDISGSVTVSVLESASKRLPPLVQNLSISTVSWPGRAESGFAVRFNVYDNRTPGVLYTMQVYKDGELLGQAMQGAATLFPPKDGEMMFSGSITAAWAGALNFERLPKGTYTVDLRVTDEDDNTTPDLVNQDGMPENDTVKTIVIE